ncbi:expansin EXLX1 family cellulose-binding protein [Actinomadura craniellae]|uniref:expansin EXLX1 family cellulose-binding protein n=1 Tax=Actinomadura craniellae TaxID=2231787 RepID=UPI0011BD5A17|nr:expansin EXLX1 family cellulose-binding protein [Actinomadura craniellae]
MRRRSPAGPRRVLRMYWSLSGVAALAAIAVAVTVAGVSGAACAGVLARAGKATSYTMKEGGGNCSYPARPADLLYAAVSESEYRGAAACGGYLDVAGPRGAVRVKVVDRCPECAAGHIDLSPEAFARVTDRPGEVPVSYRWAVDPRPPAPLSFRVKNGSSRWWLAIQAIDHGNPLALVEVRAGAGWRALARADYNYWLAEDGAGPGPFTVRLTDTRGHRAVVGGIRLAPMEVQATRVAMYGTRRPAPRPAFSLLPADPLAPVTPAAPPPAPAPARAAPEPRC